jgi:GT2 family glycosyltransferase
MNSHIQTRISVVIPTYKRPCALQRCLEALCAQTYPADLFEVIVVNDGGQPCPEELLSGILTRLRVRLVNQENTGPGGARNRGAGEAKYELLAFLDDDCIPAREWLEALNAAYISTPDKVFAGRTVNGCKDNPFASTSQMLNDYLQSNSLTIEGNYTFATSSNLAIGKNFFFELGGFNKKFRIAAGEDRDLCTRLEKMGYRIVLLENIIISHFHDLNMWSFIRQQYNYGRGAYLFRLRKSHGKKNRLSLEKFSFYHKLFISAFGYAFNTKSYSVPFLTLVSQLAVAMGFLRELCSVQNSGE